MKNRYPFIFVHGMLGWGERELFYKPAPYWGMVCGNLMKQLRSAGYEAYAPKVGPMNSAWDRACELYALLTGTRVDYGKAHSEQKHHERFGRTYEQPLFPGWGSEKKVHLLGHSFGGATIRLLTELLTNGDPEERDSTSASELSPLFVGGHGDWVATVTTISAPHDGSTFLSVFPHFVGVLTPVLYGAFAVLGNTPANLVYDPMLEQFEITSLPGKTNLKKILDIKQFQRIHNAMSHDDNVFSNLKLENAEKLNRRIHCSNQVYYFSVTGLGTKPDPKHPENQVRAPIMNPAFIPFAKKMGAYEDPEWRANDGLVPVKSGRFPSKEPHTLLEEGEDKGFEKGIWYVMPDYIADHGTVIGGSLYYIGPGRSKPFKDFYRNHLDRLISLE